MFGLGEGKSLRSRCAGRYDPDGSEQWCKDFWKSDQLIILSVEVRNLREGRLSLSSRFLFRGKRSAFARRVNQGLEPLPVFGRNGGFAARSIDPDVGDGLFRVLE